MEKCCPKNMQMVFCVCVFFFQEEVNGRAAGESGKHFFFDIH